MSEVDDGLRAEALRCYLVYAACAVVRVCQNVKTCRGGSQSFVDLKFSYFSI